MKNSKLILISLISASMMLAGCGNERPASSIPEDSSIPFLTSQITPSDESSVDSSSLPGDSSESIPEISSSVPAESSSQEPPVESSSSSEPEIIYTAAEAIDAVASLMSTAFGETVSANHTDEGEYIVLNLGNTAHDTIKAYSEYYFVPEGFEMIADWAEDSFGDGTPVEYADFICGDTGLEYLVYDVSGYEGDLEGYNGTYLQVQAFDLSEEAE